jgi:uncharacterized protein (DUF3820 family)
MKPGEQKDIVIPFGKHKGELIADIEASYLKWLLDQVFFEEKFPEYYKQVKIELGYRKLWEK